MESELSLDARSLVGSHDVLLITLDTLRYDVAMEVQRSGRSPELGRLLPGGKWERRHSPGNFTYAAHQAFFAGFLPTPASPGPHERLFAARFPGSETTSERTYVFDAPNIVEGLVDCGYHTICVGGVGFFNGQSELGRVLPGLFHESHWNESLGVTDPQSTANQVAVAVDRVQRVSLDQPLFLFVNVSALHQPNCIFVEGCDVDSPATQGAALAYVDSCLPPLWDALRGRSRQERGGRVNGTLCILTSDHGTAYGEDGYWGHRLCHPVVWEVPYAEFLLEAGN